MRTGEATLSSTAGSLNPELLSKIDAWWRASNYLSLGMIYLRDNPLLTEPLRPEHIKRRPRAVASGNVERGVLLCGSGVGASVAANKVNGARAALCHDDYSARQGVEDDDMNILCLGGRTTGPAVAWDCTKNFLNARFSGAARHCRRLDKVKQLEQGAVN